MHPKHLGWLAVGTAVLMTGCGGQPALPSVVGVAMVDGRPLTAGTVTFYPDAKKGNTSPHQPVGLLDGNGQYRLTVPGGRTGAPAGWYKVVVYAVDNPMPGKPNRYLTHAKYADVHTTTLRLEVVETPEQGRYDLKLDK
jgi:hypothetical protein